jgi:UPF0755 protein
MRRLSVLLILLLAAGALAALGLRSLDAQVRAPGSNDAPVRIQIPPGATLRSTLVRLQQLGTVRSARAVAWFLRLHRLAPRLQAGVYDIPPHATAAEILDQFANGRVVLDQITVVEGWTFAQMRAALDAAPDVTHELRGLDDAAVMRALGHAEERPEGRFFPDTYRFAAGTSDRRLLEQAYERMHSELAEAWAHRAPDLPLAASGDALILASIVEKETGREDERGKVAAVFVNRLRRGMRLQSDPTVIYGLGESYDGDIHSRDLARDTPYNTYTRTGLPPTPIALPGAASLQAVTHPDAIDALYFVATGDGDGGHHFSATLAEHDEALRHYLRRIGVVPR